MGSEMWDKKIKKEKSEARSQNSDFLTTKDTKSMKEKTIYRIQDA